MIATDSVRKRAMYSWVMILARPVVRRWGRLEVMGAQSIPETGATLIIANHDSAWDPVVVGVAVYPRRQIRALAKSSLWKFRLLAYVLNGMGQIPVERGGQGAAAMESAVRQLSGGACIGVFPEGTRSRGVALRARSGVGRLALAVPEATIVCAAVSGAVDVARFPRRPRIRVRFFRPSPAHCAEGESAAEFADRVLSQLRQLAPVSSAGRKPPASPERVAPD